MANGVTKGERRRRRRAARSERPPYPDHALMPTVTPEDELREALDAQPAWARAIWATPRRRLVLSLSCAAVAVAIIAAVIADHTMLPRARWMGGFVAAPAIVAAFGAQAVEAVLDLRRGRDSLPVFHRAFWWVDRHRAVAVLYLGVMIPAAVWLHP